MKKVYVILALLLCVLFPYTASASEVSSDKMILEWYSRKVWLQGGELCVTGEFINRRNDVTITKLNDFEIRITFKREDGTEYQFTGRPKKMPMCKIPARGSKKLILNFGPFTGTWKSWVTGQDYVFTYINGARF